MRICRALAVAVCVAAPSYMPSESTSWTLYSASYGQVYPITIPEQAVGPSIDVSGTFSVMDIAITPDGMKALVVGNLQTSGSVVNVLDLSHSSITVATVEGFVSPQCVAITPDGTKAVVTDSGTQYGSVCLLDLTGPIVTITDWGDSSGDGVFGVAITPDGNRALVANSSTSVGGSLGVYTIGSTIRLHQVIHDSSGLWKIAITPDGTKAIATTQGGGIGVRVFNLTPTSVQSAYTVDDTGTAQGVAITPDGSVGIVVNDSSNTISILDLTLPIVTKKQPDVASDATQQYIAISPDGTTAYTSDPWDRCIYAYDLTKSPVLAPSWFSATCLSLAITPDQAPTAAFTTEVTGLTVFCNASDSSSPVGSIATYQWDFGDGVKETTDAPFISHAYQNSGPQTVSLTVVNSAGTSTSKIFTGQTMSRRGMSRAQVTKKLLLATSAPEAFIGRVSVDKKKRQVFLTVSWSLTADANVAGYELFEYGQCIASVSARTSSATFRLNPHHLPKKISRKYRIYLQDKYSIRTVAVAGPPSQGKWVEIKS